MMSFGGVDERRIFHPFYGGKLRTFDVELNKSGEP